MLQLKLPVSCPSKVPRLTSSLLSVFTKLRVCVCVCVSQALLIDKWNPDLPASISASSAVKSNPSCYGGDQHGSESLSARTGTNSDLPARLFISPIFQVQRAGVQTGIQSDMLGAKMGARKVQLDN